LRDNFERECKRINSGRQYGSVIQNDFPRFRWYFKLSFKNRRHITTVIRMRTGHCLTRWHLFKLGIGDDPFCDFGTVDNLDHIFFECRIHELSTLNLYEEFIKLGLRAPLRITTVLQHPMEKVVDTLMNFININKLNL